MNVFVRCLLLGTLSLGLAACGASATNNSSSTAQARPEPPAWQPPPPGVGVLAVGKRTPDQVAADIGADKTSKEATLTDDGRLILESGTYEVTLRSGALGTGDQRVGDTSTVWLVHDDGRRWLLPEPWTGWEALDGQRVRVTGDAIEMEVPEFEVEDWEPVDFEVDIDD